MGCTARFELMGGGSVSRHCLPDCGDRSAFVAGQLGESDSKKAPKVPDVGRGTTHSVPVILHWAERGALPGRHQPDDSDE
jgi:hypothetical protein